MEPAKGLRGSTHCIRAATHFLLTILRPLKARYFSAQAGQRKTQAAMNYGAGRETILVLKFSKIYSQTVI